MNIYKIICNGKEYVGKCKQWEGRGGRKQRHKSSVCNPDSRDRNVRVYKWIRENGGWENCTFQIIEECTVDNVDELERKYVLEIPEDIRLNSDIPGGTPRCIISKRYRLKHAEKVAFDKKIWNNRKSNCKYCGNLYNNSSMRKHIKRKHPEHY